MRRAERWRERERGSHRESVSQIHIKRAPHLTPLSLSLSLPLLLALSLSLSLAHTHNPSFMGNAGYLYLISTAVLPIEQSMKKRSQFRVAFGASIIVTTILNIGFAVLAAMAYTQTTGGVQSIVVLNLRPGALAACVKIFVAINQLFTYVRSLTFLTTRREQSSSFTVTVVL